MTLAEVKQAFREGQVKARAFVSRSGREYIIYWEQTHYIEDDAAGACLIGWAADPPRRGRAWRYLNPENLEIANGGAS